MPGWVSVRRQWTLLGRRGHVAVIGLLVAMVVAVLLGFAIPASVERNLLDTRAEVFDRIAADLVDGGLMIPAPVTAEEVAALDEAVRLRVIGVDVVRVILWDENRTVVYSDAAELVGLTSAQSHEIDQALAGITVVGMPDPTEDHFETQPDLSSIREYYLPVVDQTGQTVAVFEVYEDAVPISSTLASTRRMVWLSISFGLGVVVVFVLALSAANARGLDRRRRQAERLVAEMATAQEEERTRIIGSLHDDIGQPLYRVLYGIEGSLSRIDPDSPVNEELVRIGDLVRRIDGDLRSELLMLHQGAIHENDLDTLLQRLVEDVQAESQVEISLAIGPHVPLAEGPRAALFRATREAVTNARKHSGASVVEINVTEGSHRVIVDVEDDGKGVTGGPGMGLQTNSERLEALGGGLKVIAGTDGGTLFRAWVPVSPGGGEQ